MSSSNSEETHSIFIGKVIQRTAKLEHLLEQNFGAVGTGLGQKVINVEDKLDPDIVRQLRFIIAVRNKITHNFDYIYDGNTDDYLRKCDEIISRLSNPSVREQTYTPPPPKVNVPPSPKADTTYNYPTTPPKNHSYSSSASSNYSSTRYTPSRVKVRHAPLIPSGKIKAFFKTIFATAVILILIVYVVIPIISSVIPIISNIKSQRGSSADSTSRPTPQLTVKVEKTGPGRTPNEKMYQFTVPAKKWVETSIKIKPNQEVMIHHFTSAERISVSLGEFMDNRLQTPGTILPLYTSKDCSKDRGVQAKVRYTCVQLSQPESVKLYAENSAPVGIYIRNR